MHLQHRQNRANRAADDGEREARKSILQHCRQVFDLEPVKEFSKTHVAPEIYNLFRAAKVVSPFSLWEKARMRVLTGLSVCAARSLPFPPARMLRMRR